MSEFDSSSKRKTDDDDECCAKPFLITGFIVVCFLKNLLLRLFLSRRAVFPDV